MFRAQPATVSTTIAKQAYDSATANVVEAPPFATHAVAVPPFALHEPLKSTNTEICFIWNIGIVLILIGTGMCFVGREVRPAGVGATRRDTRLSIGAFAVERACSRGNGVL